MIVRSSAGVRRSTTSSAVAPSPVRWHVSATIAKGRQPVAVAAEVGEQRSRAVQDALGLVELTARGEHGTEEGVGGGRHLRRRPLDVAHRPAGRRARPTPLEEVDASPMHPQLGHDRRAFVEQRLGGRAPRAGGRRPGAVPVAGDRRRQQPAVRRGVATDDVVDGVARRLELGEHGASAPATSPTRTRSRASSGSAQRRHGSVGSASASARSSSIQARRSSRRNGSTTAGVIAASAPATSTGSSSVLAMASAVRAGSSLSPAAVCWLCSTDIRASSRERGRGRDRAALAPALRARARSLPRWRRARRAPRRRRRRGRLRRSVGRRRPAWRCPAASTNVAVAARAVAGLPHGRAGRRAAGPP